MTRGPKPLPGEGSPLSASDPEAVLQVKIWLLGISPMVWRPTDPHGPISILAAAPSAGAASDAEAEPALCVLAQAARANTAADTIKSLCMAAPTSILAITCRHHLRSG